MLLNTLKNEKFKKVQKNPLEARFYCFFLGFIGWVFNSQPCLSLPNLFLISDQTSPND